MFSYKSLGDLLNKKGCHTPYRHIALMEWRQKALTCYEAGKALWFWERRYYG